MRGRGLLLRMNASSAGIMRSLIFLTSKSASSQSVGIVKYYSSLASVKNAQPTKSLTNLATSNSAKSPTAANMVQNS